MVILDKYDDILSERIIDCFQKLTKTACYSGYKQSWAWYQLIDKEDPMVLSYSLHGEFLLIPMPVMLAQLVEFDDKDLRYIQTQLSFKKGWIFYAKKQLREILASWIGFINLANNEWLTGEDCQLERQNFTVSHKNRKDA